MKKRRLFTLLAGAGLVLILAVVPFLSACAPAPPKQVELEILAGPVNSFQATGTAEILNKNHPWIRASVTETTGSSAAIALGAGKDPKQVLMAPAEEAYVMAKAGTLTPGNTYPDLRWIAAWTMTNMALVTLDPDINTVEDLRGKRVAILEKADANTVVLEDVFSQVGILDTIEFEHMDFPFLLEPLKDGLVDAAIGWGELYADGWGALFFLEELIALKGDQVHTVAIDVELLKQAMVNTGFKFGTMVLPAGTYGAGQTEPTGAMTFVSVGLACYAGADEEVIYEITKMMYEHRAELADYYPPAGAITDESVLSLLPVESPDEIHPGALRYYEEIGLYPAHFPTR